MPKNRHTLSREEKTEELVAIALRLFLEKGYAGTTMASIGAGAGIATNVVHWYFPTKDELFVAALESYQSESLEELMERPAESQPAADDRQLLAERVGLAIKTFGPHIAAINGIDQLGRYSYLIARFPYAAQEHITNPEVLPDFLNIDSLPFVLERRIPRQDVQFRETRQLGNDIFR